MQSIEVLFINAFAFTVEAQDGSRKVLVIVNTATGCGFTPQYSELQEMYEELKGKGLEGLHFPCNQFADQAPGSDEEIHDFCKVRYGNTFPQYSKIDVNGDNAIPLYKWITEKQSSKDPKIQTENLHWKKRLKKMSKKYDALKLDNQLCFPLYVVSKEIVRRYTPFLNEIDLTYTQYIAMMVMWEHRELSVKELGKKLFLDSGTLTPLLKTLEKRNL